MAAAIPASVQQMISNCGDRQYLTYSSPDAYVVISKMGSVTEQNYFINEATARNFVATDLQGYEKVCYYDLVFPQLSKNSEQRR